MHVGDRGLVEKIAEPVLALNKGFVRLTQLLADPALRRFEFGDLAYRPSQSHPVHDQRRQLPEHLRFGRSQFAWGSVGDTEHAQIESVMGAQRSGRVETHAGRSSHEW